MEKQWFFSVLFGLSFISSVLAGLFAYYQRRRLKDQRVIFEGIVNEAVPKKFVAVKTEIQNKERQLAEEQQRIVENEARFRLAIRGSGAIIWDVDMESKVFHVSERFYELLGYDVSEVDLVMTTFKKMVHPEDWSLIEKAREQFLNGEVPRFECEFRMISKEGNYLWFETRGLARKNKDGQITMIAGSMIDITKLKKYGLELERNCKKLEETLEELMRTQQALVANYEKLMENQNMLRRSEEQHRLVIEASNWGIWEIDLVQERKFCSPRWYELLGYDQEVDDSQVTLENLVHPDDISIIKGAIKKAFEISIFQCKVRLRMRNGEYRWFMNRGKVLFKRGVPYRIAGSTEDIDDLRVSEERLRYLAYYDVLTGLPNRLFLMEELEKHFSARSDQRFALFFVDTDNFKFVNDTLGHKYGDELLISTADRLTELIGKEGMLFRLSGDEFIILMETFEQDEQVKIIADKIIEGFQDPFCIYGQRLFVSVSIGIALYPEDGTRIEDILRKADTAMYKSKEAGKGRYTLFTSLA